MIFKCDCVKCHCGCVCWPLAGRVEPHDWAHDVLLLLNLLNTWISQATLLGLFSCHVLPWQQTQHFLIRMFNANRHFLIKLLRHHYSGEEPYCTELYNIVNGVWPITSPIHHRHLLPVDFSVNNRIDKIVSLTEWLKITVFNTLETIQYIGSLVVSECVCPDF